MGIYHYVGASAFFSVFGEQAVIPGVRHHVAAAYDGRGLRVFLDGIPNGERAVSQASIAEEAPLRIGASALDGTAFFDGTIEEVRLSKIGRYIAPFKPENRLASDENTIALFRFGEAKGQATASEGGGYSGRLGSAADVDANDPTWTTCPAPAP